MGKIAVFSNGHTDTYKGKRPVSAAWMVTTANGSVYSGHSLDRAKAVKTASSYVCRGCKFSALRMVGTGGHDFVTPEFAAYALKIAKEAGFDTRKLYNANADAKRAEYAAKAIVEIVDL